MSLKNDPTVAALIEKAVAKAKKEEQKRVLELVKEAKTGAGNEEDPAVRKTVKTYLTALVERVKEAA